jgi:hypothetical protein
MVRKAANEAFSMPHHMEDLLPSSYLPIAQMLEFGLPLQNTSPSAPLPAQYFSSTPPDITGEALWLRVRRLPIPDTKTVHKLPLHPADLAAAHTAISPPVWADWETAPHRHFYIRELAQCKNNDYILPVKWIVYKDAVHADAYAVTREPVSAIIRSCVKF